MLSFLRDQNSADLPGQASSTPAGEPPVDGAEPSQEQQFLTVAAQGKRTRKSTMLLAILFVMGLLCLGYMIKKSAPQTASATTNQTEETKVEAALARLTGVKSEMFSKMDQIVKKFYEFSSVMQVQVNELAKNPFTLELLLADAKEVPVVEETSEMDFATIWRQQMRQKTKDMKLLSIMCSDQGKTCMIGSKILCEGESIQGFKVREIGDSFVKLEWSGEQGNGALGAPPDSMDIVLRLSQ
jgi:hypothetical protein